MALSKAYSQDELDIVWLLSGVSSTEVKATAKLGPETPEDVVRWFDGQVIRIVMDVGPELR